MHLAARLAARARQHGLVIPEPVAGALVAYFELLQRWNRKINLTSLSDPDEALDRLILEPVAAAEHLPSHGRLADLGSGGGSPAIPLALVLGASKLLMVESRSRKAAFLREAAREVHLPAIVEAGRFEDVSRQAAYAHHFDLVSVRAVRPDAAALGASADLVRPGGLVALFGGPGSGAPPSLPEDLTWRGTWPLLPSSGSQLTLVFHVEHR
jgi:16S rRNA (guanine527-N7)-methyltransferase